MPKMTELFGQKDEKKIDRKWVTTWIHYSKLKKNPGQYKERTREVVEELADMIEADGGVLQNLIVRKCDADQYEIVAGHRRTLACQLLVEERNKKEYAFLPCVIRNVSDAKSRFALVSTNGYGIKTAYETMHEIEEMLYLLENYPEEFPELQEKGRMVEKLAKRLNMFRSVISDYQNISHNLCETGREMFKAGELNKSAAVQLAGMEEKEQERLLKQGVTKAAEIKSKKKSQNEETVRQKQSVPKFGTELEVEGIEEVEPADWGKYEFGICPHCGKQVNSYFNEKRCGGCGGKLRWKEESGRGIRKNLEMDLMDKIEEFELLEVE